MRIAIGSLLIALLLGGCRGYYPASILSTPPSSLPLRHKRSAPAFRDQPPSMRWESARTLSLDYTGGPGTKEGNHLHIVRPQITFATLTDDSTSVGRSAFGGMVLAGTYKGKRWIEGDRLDSVLRNLSVFGLAGYYDGNIGLAGKALSLGVGWTCMAALEGGGYYSVWHHGSGWPWPILPQVGAYLFLDADLSSYAGFWVRTGFAIPGPLYLDGGISWKEFTASFGASILEKEIRFTAGVHYRLP